MTITIDIPAISELAAAINNLASQLSASFGPQSPSGVNPDRVIAHEPQPVTADGDFMTASHQRAKASEEGAPAKRTRRTKAEMDAERKAIEETKGRRAEPIEAVSALVDEANAAPFQWTLEQLKDTFLAITPEDDSQEAKDAANAKLLALRQIREAIAPEAQNLSTMDEKHYAEFARQATAWYREQGLELKLPEGAE